MLVGRPCVLPIIIREDKKCSQNQIVWDPRKRQADGPFLEGILLLPIVIIMYHQ